MLKPTTATAVLVEELIDHGLGQWDEEALAMNLFPADAEKVRRIPIGKLETDSWVWQLENNGNISVRSSYRAIMAARATSIASSSSVESNNYWKTLWKMPVLPKVRNFWWRVIKRFIPCLSVLHQRHIEPREFCLECGREETIVHALFECIWAKRFWKEIKILARVKIPQLMPSWSIDILFEDFIPKSEAAIIMCGAWSVWSSRNARKHGEKGYSVISSVRWTLDVAIDLSISGKQKKQQEKSLMHWSKPPPGVMKVNVDASFIQENHTGATCVGIRGHTGELVRAQALWYDNAASVLVMEAYAVRDGARLACDLRMQHVTIETDAQLVIDLWNGREEGRCEIAGILQEVKQISEGFQSFHLNFIGRGANGLAHLCAGQASSSRRRCLWLNCIPDEDLWKDA